jgi:hypothetical protein
MPKTYALTSWRMNDDDIETWKLVAALFSKANPDMKPTDTNVIRWAFTELRGLITREARSSRGET